MAAASGAIRSMMSTEHPSTSLPTDDFLTTFNTTTEESLLDGFDATTITGAVIGGLFMLVMLCLPLCWVCSGCRKGWRKDATTTGQSSDRAYSNYTSEDKKRKSAGNIYQSENESGYKSESDFRCTSDYQSESEFKSEIQADNKASAGDATNFKIEDEKKPADVSSSHGITENENKPPSEDDTDEGAVVDEVNETEGDADEGDNTWL